VTLQIKMSTTPAFEFLPCATRLLAKGEVPLATTMAAVIESSGGFLADEARG
jgi:hypothetical protein